MKGHQTIIRIRHVGDKKMFFGNRGWSLNWEIAHEFNTPLQAVAFIVQRQLGHEEIIAQRRRTELWEVAAAP